MKENKDNNPISNIKTDYSLIMPLNEKNSLTLLLIDSKRSS